MNHLHKFFWPVLGLVTFLSLILIWPPKCRYTIANTGIIHGVYPGGFSGEEDDFSELDIISYERAAHKKAAFIYFSHNWYKDRKFPKKMVDMIYSRNSIPFIRLMLRSHPLNQGHNEKEYSLERINKGELDTDLKAWFEVAKSYDKPMFVEYGTEVNGDFFPWNGSYSGKSAEPFKKAYQHIIMTSRYVGATNILWAFHLNDRDVPNESWNKFENYYPGTEYIDLINLSIYGMLTSKDVQQKYVGKELETLYPRVSKMSPDKKMFLIEWASTKDNKHQSQTVYARGGFEALLSGKYPNLIGFSWWNEFWFQDKRAEPISTMRLQDNPKLAKIFRQYLSRPIINTSVEFNNYHKE